MQSSSSAQHTQGGKKRKTSQGEPASSSDEDPMHPTFARMKRRRMRAVKLGQAVKPSALPATTISIHNLPGIPIPHVEGSSLTVNPSQSQPSITTDYHEVIGGSIERLESLCLHHQAMLYADCRKQGKAILPDFNASRYETIKTCIVLARSARNFEQANDYFRKASASFDSALIFQRRFNNVPSIQNADAIREIREDLERERPKSELEVEEDRYLDEIGEYGTDEGIEADLEEEEPEVTK